MKIAAASLLFLIRALPLHGQSALDGFDPNANGVVRIILVQPDGRILIGGDFTTLAPNGGVAVTRNHIARLNPDGTLDAAFDPNADGWVDSIATQADGKILVGGGFTTIDGQTRNRIARLDATTGFADSFDPNANEGVTTIAVQADGRILVGGYFTTIGGQTRNRIARLDPTTGLADSFDPNANSDVRSIVVQSDGKVVVGGSFQGANSIGGQVRNYLARLDATTGLADSFNPNANSPVYTIAVQADGKILVGGIFSNIGAQMRLFIARLDAMTGLADSFNPNANDTVVSIAVQADGKILACGFFHGTNSIGGQTRNGIARLDATTGLADSFDPNAGVIAPTLAIAVQPDGKILAGGNFTTLAPIGGAPVTRNRIARLEIDGRLDRTLNPGVLGLRANNAPYGNWVGPSVVQPDGKILIGGRFTSVLGVARRGIARLNADGTLDLRFNPNPNGWAQAIALQADGKIVVGGYFTSIGRQARSNIARLDPITGAADSFDAHADGSVNALTMQPDGKIIVGGSFHVIGGQQRNYVARLDPITGLADSFSPNPDYAPYSYAIQADGKILAAGYFSHIGGRSIQSIARLDATTGMADSFDPQPFGSVYSVIVQPDGKILVGGTFSMIGGRTRGKIARLDPTTALPDSFNPNITTPGNAEVYSVAVQADGRVLAGGTFTSAGGQTRNKIARFDGTTGLVDSFDGHLSATDFVGSIVPQPDGKILVGGTFANICGQNRTLFARLTSDTAALQTLRATQTSVTWTRSGSGPQLTRVVFEYSTDGASYIGLGNGTATGSNWALSGLDLPTNRNILVRARGYSRNGLCSTSESITESVRNIFLPGDQLTPDADTTTPTSFRSLGNQGTVRKGRANYGAE